MDERLVAYRLLIADVFELAGAARAASEQLAAQVGQTAARWHVMSVVSDGGLTMPAIARRLGVTRQSVRRVVNDLADGRRVVLEPNPDHARSPLVVLTDAGRRDLDALFTASQAARLALLDRAGISENELAHARRVVGAIAAALD